MRLECNCVNPSIRFGTGRGGRRVQHAIDLYPPTLRLPVESTPWVAVVFQGVDIDESEYALLANHLVSAGLWVAIPNCIPPGRDYLCPDAEAVVRVHSYLLASDVSGLRGAVGQGLLLLGHSAGGMAALEAAAMVSSDLMRDLRGVVTYGANAPFKFAPGAQMPLCLIIAGSQDGIVPADLSY